MGGIKRKEAPSQAAEDAKKLKTSKVKPSKAREELLSSDAENDFGGFDEEDGDDDDGGIAHGDEADVPKSIGARVASATNSSNGTKEKFKLDNGTSSAETHAKQRALAKERKANKPNSDAIQRSKKIWERLRRKSHVPRDERKELVAELFEIITGRIRDFVFKHDSVRVIQCALKYANQEQRRIIVLELKGDIRTLAESRYGKFLVAKMVSTGDEKVRDAVVPEFYGHVRRLVNHPEASWIVDDIYRQIATPMQKAMMLREWYGAEFALFHRKPNATIPDIATQNEDTADLVKILEQSPEKRKPILQYLLQMVNSLIQKKMTGFTILHDAMLQYFLALDPGSEPHTEFLEILKGDIDAETEGGGGDLFRNLAFTKSGSRLVCLALAYGSAKDRKTILRLFRDAIDMMAADQYAKMVLIVGMDVPDDTKMSSKAVLFGLLGQNIADEMQRLDRLEGMVLNLNVRLPILYPLAGMAKWLVTEPEKAILMEVHEIRKESSKKDPVARRNELVEFMSASLLEVVEMRAANLVKSSFGCQFVTETLLETNSDMKQAAKSAVANLTDGDPLSEGHIAKDAAGGRMLKTLVLGGQFNSKTKKVTLAESRLGFATELYPVIKENIVSWACSDSSFVVVGLLESEDVEQSTQKDIQAALKNGRKKIELAAKGDGGEKKGNAGARILLGKIA